MSELIVLAISGLAAALGVFFASLTLQATLQLLQKMMLHTKNKGGV